MFQHCNRSIHVFRLQMREDERPNLKQRFVVQGCVVPRYKTHLQKCRRWGTLRVHYVRGHNYFGDQFGDSLWPVVVN